MFMDHCTYLFHQNACNDNMFQCVAPNGHAVLLMMRIPWSDILTDIAMAMNLILMISQPWIHCIYIRKQNMQVPGSLNSTWKDNIVHPRYSMELQQVIILME